MMGLEMMTAFMMKVVIILLKLMLIKVIHMMFLLQDMFLVILKRLHKIQIKISLQ